MKNKILYILTIIVCICVSTGITFIIVENKFKQLEIGQNKIITEVSIKEENTIKASVEKIKDAVIYVETSYSFTNVTGGGTGFVYKVDDEYGYILTCHHVIDKTSNVKVVNNAGQTVEATILGSDELADIAVLRVPKDFVMSVAEIGDSSKLEIGDTIFSIGSPVNKEYMGTVTKGILSGKDRTVKIDKYRMDVLQTDAAINPGNSGGPIVNINGEVVGIASLKLVKDEIEGMGFAIPIEVAISGSVQLEKGEAMIRPVLGVELIDASSTYSLYLHHINIDVNYGAVVVGLEDNYPASKAGLQKGDVIIEMDGVEIEDSSHLRYVLCKHNINDKIKLTVMRGKTKKEIELILDKTV